MDEEFIALMDKAVDEALRTMNNPVLYAIPRDLLVVFAAHACSIEVRNAIAEQFEHLRQAEKASKQ